MFFTFWFYLRHPFGTKIIINGHSFNTELAVTESEKERGLGYRDKLAPDSGMLFVYDHPDRYGFWMKGMHFPLDFIWINGNLVADITTNVQTVAAGQPLPTYQPKVPVDKILELNAGIVAKYGIKTGDLVRITN